MNQLEKAIQLIKLFKRKPIVDSNDVAKELKMSVRSAQRCLTEVSCCLPIEAKQSIDHKNKIEYSLMNHFKFDESLLMDSSDISIISAIFDATSACIQTGNEFPKVLDRIKEKIIQANTATKDIVMLKGNSIDYKLVEQTQKQILRYIKERRVISFDYERKNKKYIVKPYKILIYDGLWYLYAEHDCEYKKFRMEFIKNIKAAQGKSFELPSDLELKLKDAMNIWFDDEHVDIVTIEVGKALSDTFKAKSILRKQKIVKESSDGRLTIDFKANNEHDFFTQVSKWLQCLKVIGPLKYKKYLNNELEEIIKNNR